LNVVDNDRRDNVDFLGWQGIASFVGIVVAIALMLVGFAKATK
jgi:hypothetical protein